MYLALCALQHLKISVEYIFFNHVWSGWIVLEVLSSVSYYLSLEVTDLKLATFTKHYVLYNILQFQWNLFF